jgi:Xaa-Pro aminopeptidase
MFTRQIFCAILSLLFLLGFSGSTTSATAEDFQSQWEISCMIRNDKFDYVLPNAMRRNDIDMWIVIDHGRGTDPMMLDFGIGTAYGQGIYIFYDGGGDRIERFCLGGPGSSDLSEMCGAYDKIQGKGDLRSIVYDRDPKRIALNYLDPPIRGEGVYHADGLSYMDYRYLVKELGEKYAERFVSSQPLIVDFHGEHVAGEIVEMSKVAEITRKLLERALSNEVITPGKTTYNDVARWLEEQREAMGLDRNWYPSIAFPQTPGFKGYQTITEGTERVIQRGDILFIDYGLVRNNFSTDMKRNAYVLKEGELEAPPGILKAFGEAKKVREIIRKNVRSGRTGREQLDELRQIVRDAGYVIAKTERPSDVSGIEVSIGMHGMDKIAHAVAACLADFSPELTEYEIRPNAFLALEFRIFVPAEGWEKKITIAIEENVLITEHGIEWLHPPQDRILLIR